MKEDNKTPKLFLLSEEQLKELFENQKMKCLEQKRKNMKIMGISYPPLPPALELPSEDEIENAKHTSERSTFQGTPCVGQERIAFDCGFRMGAKYILNLIKPSGK